MRRLETYYIPSDRLIATEPVGDLVVKVFEYADHDREVVYAVFDGDKKIRCWSDHDERTFPKHAAHVGQAMVDAITADRARRTKGGER